MPKMSKKTPREPPEKPAIRVYLQFPEPHLNKSYAKHPRSALSEKMRPEKNSSRYAATSLRTCVRGGKSLRARKRCGRKVGGIKKGIGERRALVGCGRCSNGADISVASG